MPRLGAMLLAALIGLGACGGNGDPTPPAVGLEQLQERTRSPRDRPLLLVFWATWCDPCVAEIPDLVALQARHPDELEILSVSLDVLLHPLEKSRALVQAQLERTPTPYEHCIYVGMQDALFAAFELPGGIPYALLFDAGGKLVRHFNGRVPVEELEQLLAVTSHRSL